MNKLFLPLLFLPMALSAFGDVGDLPTNPPADLITDPVPGATPTVLIKNGLGLYPTGTSMDALPSDGSLTKMIRDGDRIYLSRVFSWIDTPGWIEGTVTDGKAEFRFPQLIGSTTEDVGGILQVHDRYAVVCEQKMISSSQADMVPTPEQTMTFTLDSDGSLIPDDPELFLGYWEYADYTWEWKLGGDFYTLLAPQTQVAESLPEGVELQPMQLVYPHVLYGGMYTDPVLVGFRDDDCWIQGMAVGIADLPDAVIKGKVSGDTVIFDGGQFLGDSWLYGFTQYFLAGDTAYVSDSYMPTGVRPVFTPGQALTFLYDIEAGTLTSTDSFIIVPYLQENPDDLYYENIYRTPELFPARTGSVENLVTPELIRFMPADTSYPNVIEFVVSMVSADGVPLDMEKLAFEIYADGVPFEFTPAMDPALRRPVSLIPFGSNDYYCFVAQEKIVQLVALPDVDFHSLSLRLVYDAQGETPVYSDFLPILSSGVEEITQATPALIDTYFIGMDGRPANPKAAGLLIRVDRLADGTLRHTKILQPTK